MDVRFDQEALRCGTALTTGPTLSPQGGSGEDQALPVSDVSMQKTEVPTTVESYWRPQCLPFRLTWLLGVKTR